MSHPEIVVSVAGSPGPPGKEGPPGPPMPPTTTVGTWGYVPTVVIENGGTIPTPLPTLGLVIERP